MPQLLLVVLRVLIFSLLLLERKLRWQQFRLVMATFLLLIPTIKVDANVAIRTQIRVLELFRGPFLTYKSAI